MLRTILPLVLSFLLAACGFHLRGNEGMPFHTLYLETGNPNSALARELRRNLEEDNVTLVNSAQQADVVLSIETDIPAKQILTLNSAGRVNEFRLNYLVSLRAYDLQNREWVQAEEISMSRDYSYDDNEILAKESEEQLLYNGMRSDMVQQIMRRLSRAKPMPQ